MPDADIWRRLIVRSLKELGTRARDNANGDKRAAIAELYLRLGEKVEAARWLIETAKQRAWSESGANPMTVAQRAIELAPDNLSVRREYEKLLRRFGACRRASTAILPEKLRPGKRTKKPDD